MTAAPCALQKQGEPKDFDKSAIESDHEIEEVNNSFYFSYGFPTNNNIMRKDIDELDVEFNFKAKETFFILFTRFQDSARELNRMRDENVFQQKRAQYRTTIKQELERIAMLVIESNQGIHEVNILKRNLTNRINDYLQEFMIKSEGI